MATFEIKTPTVTKAIADARNGVPRYEITDSRAKGLRLRVGAEGPIWQFRFMMDSKPSRLTLGGVDTWSIAEARTLVSDAQVLIRGRVRRPDEQWVAEQLIAHGKVEAPAVPVLVAEAGETWLWERAILKFLDHVFATLHEPTWKDYRNRLKVPELGRFAGKPVAGITRKDMAKVLVDIHARGVESQAEHVRDVVKSLWSWLSLDAHNDDSGVPVNLMVGLRAPARTKLPEVRKGQYTPPMHEIGRIMAIAQSGAIDERISLGIQLLLYTCQRVLPVTRARRDGMTFAQDRTTGLWSMSAAHRKTADKRGDDSDHVVPLPRQPWAVVQRAEALTEEMDSARVFPGFRPKRAGGTVDAMGTSAIQHNMSYMPGIRATPHDVRRSFSKLAAAEFGWSILQVKSILDHNEGIPSGDVTARSYLFRGDHEKWSVITSWCDWVDQATLEAIAYDSRLLDVEWIKGQIERARRKHKGLRVPPISLPKVVQIDAR